MITAGSREVAPTGRASRPGFGGGHLVAWSGRPADSPEAAMDELDRARLLVRDAGAEFADDPVVSIALAECVRRMDEPLRVALAGTLKSGKSTLLNALVGDEIAPADATECTRVVTWFGHSGSPRVNITDADGRRHGSPVRRRDSRLVLELDGVAPERVRRLEVGWPSPLLERYTLIDTPGTSSTTPGVSERTLAFLTPSGAASQADAVVYLMRSRHDADLDLLRRIHEHDGGPLGVVGVLSRADELSAATDGVSGMDAARNLTEQLRTDPALVGVQRDFVAVSGLLAVRGRTLRTGEFAAISELAVVAPETLRAVLISPGRFLRADLPALPDEERAPLLDRFGLIGIRVAVELMRRGAAEPAQLARALVEHSGLGELCRTLEVRFGNRHRQLKAHAALRDLRVALAAAPARRSSRLLRAADRLLADSHAITELRALATLNDIPLEPSELAALDRVLGGRGLSAASRLGLPGSAGPAQLRAAAGHELSHWHFRLGEPLLDPVSTRAFRAAIRSCESVISRLGAQPSRTCPRIASVGDDF
jgi:hypothetical protein